MLIDGFDAIGEWPEFAEAIDVLPDIFVRSVEDMRPIFVEHDAGGMIPFGMTVSTEVAALVDDFDADFEAFREFPSQHCARKASANDEKMWGQLGKS